MSNIVEFNQEQVDLIKKQICPNGTTDAELQLFVAQCKRTGLDPFNRQIYLQERRSKNQQGNWESKKNVQVSIDGFRVIAQRSGVYAGQVGPHWCGDDGVWREVWLETKPPRAARVGVLRQDFKEPLWAVARWESYVQTKQDGFPNAMWGKMPDLMLAKVAEALALRKAFPNDLSGLYSDTEMDQADNIVPPKLVGQAETPKHLPAPTREIKNHATGEIKTITEAPQKNMSKEQFDIGEYVVQCGKKLKGKTLDQIGYDEILSYCEYLDMGVEKTGKELTGAFLEFRQKADVYLNQGLSAAGAPVPTPQDLLANDEIPF